MHTSSKPSTAFCRNCFAPVSWDGDTLPKRCPACHSPRVLAHKELPFLSVAHMDCDAFYAAVEKRDDPSLRDKPVIIGGGKRGVVATACYNARIYGVHSAMPMFKALKACPDAVVMKPNMAKYSAVGQQVREKMRAITPLVEPLSIDEAFLDLTGTERLHKQSPAMTIAKLVHEIEDEIGITVSVGLSYNKFLAKLSSDFDKPRGFSIIGKEETLDVLAALPVKKIWGVGKQFEKKLRRDGIEMVSQLQTIDESDLIKRYGEMGQRLYRLSRGLDTRNVKPVSKAKSISGETTFNKDITDLDDLQRKLWRLSEKVSARAKKANKAGKTVTLKLKTAKFRSLTRSRTLGTATQLAELIYREGAELLEKECDGTPYRLIGIGISGLIDADLVQEDDLFDTEKKNIQATETAIDAIRDKFGLAAIQKGRSLRK